MWQMNTCLQVRACADRLATFHYLSVLRTIKWAPHHSLIHSLPAYPRSLYVLLLQTNVCVCIMPRFSEGFIFSSVAREDRGKLEIPLVTATSTRSTRRPVHN